MTKNKKTVLVVDDVKELRQELAYVLEDAGYDVHQADNGLLALDVLKQTPVDLLITDILMPSMDGIELVAQVKKRFSDMKIILISGGGRQPNRDKQYDYLLATKRLSGVQDVLKKPFSDQVLLDLSERLLS